MSSIGEIFKKYFKKIDNLDSELLIARAIKKPRSFILAHPEYKLSKNYELRIKNYADRRMNSEPLAYILGQKEFYGLNFKVDKNTLIPRPETELVVEEALNHITHNIKHITFIDVGTGSGCIIITLTKLLNIPPIHPSQGGFYKFLATDISQKALQVARQNAKFYKVDKKINPAPLYRKSGRPEEKWCGVKFLYGNLLNPIIKKIKNKKLKIVNCKLIIAANLPYLTPAQIKKSPSIQHEPKIALDAGRDDLKYYRRLFKQIKTFAKLALNSQICVICEIDPGQTLKIKQIIKKNFPAAKIKIKKDLKGLNRIVIAEI